MNVRPTGSNRDIIISADCRAFSPSPTSFHASNILPHLFLFTPHSMCYSFFFCLRFPPLTVGLRILFPNFRQQAESVHVYIPFCFDAYAQQRNGLTVICCVWAYGTVNERGAYASRNFRCSHFM